MEKIIKSSVRAAVLAVGFVTALIGAILFSTEDLPIIFFFIGIVMFVVGFALCYTFLPKKEGGVA